MCKSKLRNKWMQKQYAKTGWSYIRRNMQDPDQYRSQYYKADKGFYKSQYL